MSLVILPHELCRLSVEKHLRSFVISTVARVAESNTDKNFGAMLNILRDKSAPHSLGKRI